jgi:hypothetical protein
MRVITECKVVAVDSRDYNIDKDVEKGDNFMLSADFKKGEEDRQIYFTFLKDYQTDFKLMCAVTSIITLNYVFLFVVSLLQITLYANRQNLHQSTLLYC